MFFAQIVIVVMCLVGGRTRMGKGPEAFDDLLEVSVKILFFDS